MPIEKIFWQDPYLCELEARISSVEGDVVTLESTIFFAFSGGQQSDSGMIGGYEVLQAEKRGEDGGEIFYRLPEGHSLKVGDAVRVVIDREKRHRLMRLHFAAELVLELVTQHYGHPEKIGANITADKARVDFFFDRNISETFSFLQERLRELVAADLPIASTFSDRAHERRTWEIEGFAKVSCGGTHPRSTGEVGAVLLRRNNIGKGKERIEIMLAE